jgi:hypothetical protein
MVFPDLGSFDSFLEGKRYCDPQTNTLHKPERFSKNSCSQIGNILCCYYEDNGKKMLGEFREIHPDAEQALRAWHTKTKQADAEIKVTSQKRYRLHGKGSEHANGGCFG